MLGTTLTERSLMLRLVLLAVALIIGLMAFRILPLLAGLVLIILALVAATAMGEGVDGRRGRVSRRPMNGLDVQRGQLYGQASTWDTPQPYIDHPDGAGVPPGVETESRVGGLPAGSIVDQHRGERR
jgi:hypothetical protein